ncbi:MAG: DUF465 domain-containing protein [Pseudomonadota bacterium]
MSRIEHIAELERRHADLERQLEETTHHPSADSLEIAELKRQKLQIKDEIVRLRSDTLH